MMYFLFPLSLALSNVLVGSSPQNDSKPTLKSAWKDTPSSTPEETLSPASSPEPSRNAQTTTKIVVAKAYVEWDATEKVDTKRMDFYDLLGVRVCSINCDKNSQFSQEDFKDLQKKYTIPLNLKVVDRTTTWCPAWLCCCWYKKNS